MHGKVLHVDEKKLMLQKKKFHVKKKKNKNKKKQVSAAQKNVSCPKKLLFFSGTVPHTQKQPPRGVLKKSCSENMQQIYRRTSMPKCIFIQGTAPGGCF